MGTTMSSVGLANKPPALPPVKQNNNTVCKLVLFSLTYSDLNRFYFIYEHLIPYCYS